MIRKLKSKKCISIILLLVSTLVVGLSYGVFTISTSNYDATNLLISNLNYGLTIKEDGSTSTINDKVVTVPSNTIGYFNITISSINKIDSKYNLAYKTNSNVIVEYTDRTSWSSTGIIESYDNMVYTRKVRVVIDNSSNDSDAQVEFGVFGGYSFNAISSIDLGNGFITVGGPYKEITSISSKRLVDIIESDTDCLTTSSCLYGGGSLNNYLQYPTSENKNENIWRITGSYNIDDVTVAKVVGDIHSQTTVNNINNSLSLFYNTLDRKDIVIHKTNKFNCNDTGCEVSNFNNIGLLNTYEYNKIGGINSYLANTNSFFSLNNTLIQNITSSEILETNETTTSGLKPAIYLNTDIKVTGSGTASAPYKISEQSDINLMAYTLDGEATEKTYEWLLKNKAVSKVTCEKGTKAQWNYGTNSITLTDIVTPDYCTIDFKDGYLVTVTAENGNVTPSSAMVGYGGNLSVTLNPNTGYKYSSNTCDGTVSESVMTINNISKIKNCKVTFTLMTLADTIKEAYPSSGERTNFNVAYTETALHTATDYSSNGSFNGTTYYFTGNPNNWVKFAGKLWRIIRINGSGSVRLLYAGTGKEDGYLTQSDITNIETVGMNSSGQIPYNSSYNHPAYVGWKYTYNENSTSVDTDRGNSIESGAYKAVNSWYTTNITDAELANYIDTDAIYCNDRGIGSGLYSTSSGFYYQPYTRLITNKVPSLECSDSADRFTKFGLMTADEIVYAGGLWTINNRSAYYYLNKDGGSLTGNYWWWTMSPFSFDTSVFNDTWAFVVGGSGDLGLDGIGDIGVIRPVVSLKSNTLASGTGTATDPYVIRGLK